MNIADLSYEILALFGGIQIVLTGLVIFLAKIWINRIHEHDKARVTKEIDNLRNERERTIAIIDHAIRNLSSVHNASHERRIDAVARLWNAILQIREHLSTIFLLDSIILESEYAQLLDKPKTRAYIDELKQEDIVHIVNASIETDRPFLGTLLWSMFFSYRALAGRAYHLFLDGRQKGAIKPLMNDSGINQLLNYVIGQTELKTINQQSIGRFSLALRIIEQKILLEVEMSLSGERSAQFSLEQAIAIQQKAEKLLTD